MRTKLLLTLTFLLMFGAVLRAQPNGTYIVADKGSRMSSCVDSLINIAKIIQATGIRDLDDADEVPSDYRILELNGSVITQNEITEFKYSDYNTVYVEKTGTTFNGHNGVVIYLDLLVAPTSLFSEDTLKYIVERGAKKHYVEAFFANLNFWTSGLDNTTLQERILFKEMPGGTELPVTQVPNWANVGKGTYRLRYSTTLCNTSQVLWDTLYVIVEENACNNIVIKQAPSVCLDEVIDITPYVYVNGLPATPGELANMTFWDRSIMANTTDGSTIDPTAIDISTMFNNTTLYPRIEVVYAPNVALGTCYQYFYLFTPSVPTKFLVTDVVFTESNGGQSVNYNIDDKLFYTSGGVFHKNILQQVYINNYNVFAGSSFSFFNDLELQNPVTGLDLTPGDYYAVATNEDCAADNTVFDVHVRASDFEVLWQSAPALGKGYYTFNAPSYAGASYGWFVWGGSIVSGLNTEQITVYFSEEAAPAVTVTCTITFPPARSEVSATQHGSVYLSATGEDGALEEIPALVVTSNEAPVNNTNAIVAYPNPADGNFAVSGSGAFDLKVYDALGQLVYEEASYAANTPIQLQSKGLHLVHLDQNGRRQSTKVMLK